MVYTFSAVNPEAVTHVRVVHKIDWYNILIEGYYMINFDGRQQLSRYKLSRMRMLRPEKRSQYARTAI